MALCPTELQAEETLVGGTCTQGLAHPWDGKVDRFGTKGSLGWDLGVGVGGELE